MLIPNLHKRTMQSLSRGKLTSDEIVQTSTDKNTPFKEKRNLFIREIIPTLVRGKNIVGIIRDMTQRENGFSAI